MTSTAPRRQETGGLPEPARAAHAARAVRSLVGGVALGSTGHIAAVTVAALAAGELAGGATLAGAAGAAVVLGAAVGATVLAQVMVRRGRRTGLTTGYLVSATGALLGAAALVAGSLALLLVGMLLVGFGNASNQLSRYAAADMYPPERRGSAIGVVVWAATIGAVAGPNLVGPSGMLARSAGLPELVGPLLVPAVFVTIAAALSWWRLRPDPYELAHPAALAGHAEGDGDGSLRPLFARPTVSVAIVALVVGQAVMVLIMTMTPLHMRDHGHDLAAVGFVISAHTFGMFALSPISGRLSDRVGPVPVVLAGASVLAVSAVLAAAAPPEGGVVLTVALFLLGWGWNLGYVAGSSLLTAGLGLADRTRLQGLADAIIWSSSAVASLSSGVIVAVASFAALGLLGAGSLVVPAWLLLTRRRAIVAALER